MWRIALPSYQPNEFAYLYAALPATLHVWSMTWARARSFLLLFERVQAGLSVCESGDVSSSGHPFSQPITVYDRHLHPHFPWRTSTWRGAPVRLGLLGLVLRVHKVFV